VTVNELRFESRGTPSDRLKTEEEQAKDEKQRLEKLEVLRSGPSHSRHVFGLVGVP